MTSLLIFTAFVCGFLATRIGLPPLVGYLLAGFTLHYFGVESSDKIEQVADLGILLLLFSIGLKLKLKSLARAEIWASASLHICITVTFFGGLFLLLAKLGLQGFSGFTVTQAMLLGFALCFSSTVFAVKTFEERGDVGSLHSNIAIGVLIIQDIAAVIFLTFSLGKFPSIWALAVVPLLLILRPVLFWILDRCGHRELLLLFGLFVPIGLGAGGFSLVNLKPDLGALIVGVLLAKHAKAGEISDAILSLKDLLLVGFFLNIGLSGLPTFHSLAIASFFVLLISFKSVGFYALFTRFKLRARTSGLAALALTNYSEFGLLVCAIGVQQGYIEKEWLITFALALAISFVVAAPINSRALTLYSRFSKFLKQFESEKRLPDDQSIDTGDANILIFGMGRIGTRLYDSLCAFPNLSVVGLDIDGDKIATHKETGRRVIRDDATDFDLWEKICTHKVEVAMLTMASHSANMFAIQQLNEAGFKGKISATAQFPDEQEELLEAGVTFAYDLYEEAGQGYADDIIANLNFAGKTDEEN